MSLHAGPQNQSWLAGRLMGIPIRFSPWYGLFVVVVLSRAGFSLDGLLWLLCITLSIVVHELGHGLMALRYGLGADITVHAMGGWCEHAPARSRREDFFVVAAGPAAGFALALVAWLLGDLTGTFAPGRVASVLNMLAWANVFLSMFNLLPIYSLDGGRLLHIALGWQTSNYRADGMTWWVGTILGGVLALYGAMSNSLFIALICGMMAYQNYQRAQPYPIRETFRPKSYPPPSSRAGLGLSISGNLYRLAGALVGLWVLDGLVGGFFGGFAYRLALDPSAVAEGGGLWAIATYGLFQGMWGWPALLLSVAAVLVCGPAVEYRLGTRGTFGVLALALFIGALTASFLPALLGLPMMRSVSGTGAPAMALLVAWAILAPDETVGFGSWTLGSRQLALGVVALDAAAVMTGLTTWNLPLHLGGVLVGLVAAAGSRPRKTVDTLQDPPPIDLSEFRRSQGGQRDQDVWH